LPYIEQSSLYDQWQATATLSDGDPATPDPLALFDQPDPTAGFVKEGNVSHYALGQTYLQILVCPDDDTVVGGRGNLSYVLNGGMCLLPQYPLNNTGHGITGTPLDLDGDGNSISAAPSDDPEDWRAAKNMGLLFPGSLNGNTRWDVRRTLASITDGTSYTIMIGENLKAGYVVSYPEDQNEVIWYDPNHEGQPGQGFVEGTWANPDPYLCAFFVSDDICDSSGNCRTGDTETDSRGNQWQRANWSMANSANATENYKTAAGTPEQENINGAFSATEGWPYLSSYHPGGVNVVMCDGSTRFISATIDGEVLVKLVSPAGGRRGMQESWPVFQTPLDEDQL